MIILFNTLKNKSKKTIENMLKNNIGLSNYIFKVNKQKEHFLASDFKQENLNALVHNFPLNYEVKYINFSPNNLIGELIIKFKISHKLYKIESTELKQSFSGFKKEYHPSYLSLNPNIDKVDIYNAILRQVDIAIRKKWGFIEPYKNEDEEWAISLILRSLVKEENFPQFKNFMLSYFNLFSEDNNLILWDDKMINYLKSILANVDYNGSWNMSNINKYKM